MVQHDNENCTIALFQLSSEELKSRISYISLKGYKSLQGPSKVSQLFLSMS